MGRKKGALRRAEWRRLDIQVGLSLSLFRLTVGDANAIHLLYFKRAPIQFSPYKIRKTDN